MLGNILSIMSKDYKKDLGKVAIAFVGGVAVGYVLTKSINAETINNIKNEADNLISSYTTPQYEHDDEAEEDVNEQIIEIKLDESEDKEKDKDSDIEENSE